MPATICSAPKWSAIAAALQLPPDLARAPLGEAVTDHRTSWVRRVATSDGDVFLKTYEYPGWRAQLRSLGRRTSPWSKSRAHREFEALQWLRGHGFEAPEPLAVLEVRRWGFVVRALLATAAYPGQPTDRVLPTLSAAEQLDLAVAIGQLVGDLHALGFRDRNLDLRNLLVADGAPPFRLAKIDSGRFVVRRRGQPTDALAAADWRRLLLQLPPHLARAAHAAASGRTGPTQRG